MQPSQRPNICHSRRRNSRMPDPASNSDPLPVLNLSTQSEADLLYSLRESVTANVDLTVGGRFLPLKITVPKGPTAASEFLPILQKLTGAVVDIAVDNVVREGHTISCRAGCGACCRQVVPVTQTEARQLARFVATLPEPRQTEIRKRFTEACDKLAAAGLLDELRQPADLAGEKLRPFGLAYFRAGVACPFLEDESCSIYRDRPLACREHLVTSPAENCAEPSQESVQIVPLPAQVAGAARTMDRRSLPDEAGWLPLALALEWAEAHPDEPPSQPGTRWIEAFFKILTRDPHG